MTGPLGFSPTDWLWLLISATMMGTAIATVLFATIGRQRRREDAQGAAEGDAYVAELRAARLEARGVHELTHYELEHFIATELGGCPWVRTDLARRVATYGLVTGRA